ncbi:MAG: hypothetical protein JWM11_3492, partial [Planctomycetaceae bacterium]|nr:hypothetical protein [Planctomycetaceae bacterium]
MLTAVVKDNGGTANGGVDTSGPVTFSIVINPVPIDAKLEVTGLSLENDTGIPNDKISSDGTVAWGVGWIGNSGSNYPIPSFSLDFDLNDDGTTDFSVANSTQNGTVDLAQHGIEKGPVSIKARTEYHYDGIPEVQYGQWKEFSFVYGDDSTLPMNLNDQIALSDEDGLGSFLISTTLDADEVAEYWIDLDSDGNFELPLEQNLDINGAVEPEIDLKQILGTEFSRIAQSGDYPIAILVKDFEGNFKQFSSTLAVADNPPVFDFEITADVIQVFQPLTFTVAYQDAGPDPLQSVSIDWGDGAAVQTLPANSSSSVQGTHIFSESGSHWVHVTVMNNDGDFGSDYLVGVDGPEDSIPTNEPTIVEAYADVNIDESATITVHAVDASGNLGVTLAWDLNGDGVFDDGTGNSIVVQDDPDQHIFHASVQLTDANGNQVVKEFEFENSFYSTFGDPEASIGGVDSSPIRLSLVDDHAHHVPNRSMKALWADFLPGFDIDDFVTNAPRNLHGPTSPEILKLLRARGESTNRGGGAWNNENLEFFTRPDIKALTDPKEKGKQALEHLLKMCKDKGVDISNMCTYQRAFTDKNRAGAIARFVKLCDDYGIDPK